MEMVSGLSPVDGCRVLVPGLLPHLPAITPADGLPPAGSTPRVLPKACRLCTAWQQGAGLLQRDGYPHGLQWSRHSQSCAVQWHTTPTLQANPQRRASSLAGPSRASLSAYPHWHQYYGPSGLPAQSPFRSRTLWSMSFWTAALPSPHCCGWYWWPSIALTQFPYQVTASCPAPQPIYSRVYSLALLPLYLLLTSFHGACILP